MNVCHKILQMGKRKFRLPPAWLQIKVKNGTRLVKIPRNDILVENHVNMICTINIKREKVRKKIRRIRDLNP